VSNKLYNVGAYGIPQSVRLAVGDWRIDRLKWSKHAIQQAMIKGIRAMVSSDQYPHSFYGDDPRWSVVEVETNEFGHPVKIVVRRKVGLQWTLVLVIDVEGIVRTCWVNLTTDNHRTLDKSKFNYP